ncbi:MAG: tetratricopeptide repeat protein [Phycisphaerae bacterium]|jgi:tetratricopeptide (TPR) repeat protein|nr:tetratricopeptide repeat protein [Phycisphaerae bacterium]MBT5366366.1 tetratricopeptide repeat protein [Phycisphaerae bacterium]MBT6281926.1 tetratricopeptide repeat protein [Phycisphaerae bacterium]
MRQPLIMALICMILSNCSDGDGILSEEGDFNTNKIPLPAVGIAVDPNVLSFFTKTSSELDADITNPKLWLVHGSALYANGFYGLAADAFARGLEIDSEMNQASYLLATALWRANKQEEAIAALETSLELIPKYDIGWRLLAKWRVERGESELAETAARIAFNLNPNRIGTRYVLCQSLMDQSKYEEALELIEQVTTLDKAPRWIYKLAANCYRQLGAVEKMESALAMEGPPFDVWPDPMFQHIPSLIRGKEELTEYSLELFKVNGPTKALQPLMRAFAINTEHTDLRVALSMALQFAGKLQPSKQILVELQSEPNSNYWKQFASISIDFNEFEKAKEYITTAIDLEAKDANAHEIASVIAQKQDRLSDAIYHWSEAGRIYTDLEQWLKAEIPLAYAVDKGATDRDTILRLALAQVNAEHFIQARTTINILLEINPNDVDVLELQSMLPLE